MEYFEPKSISEALSVLVKHGAEAKVIAGGTDVMVDIKFKEEPGSLVNIKKLPGMSGIKENGGSLRIIASEPDAEIFVDGEDKGKSPASVPNRRR